MARGVAYLVFLLPVVISVPFASFVLADVLDEPDRELNMWPVSGDSKHNTSISFVGVSDHYDVNEPINIKAKINDPSYDCGDIYITIFDDANTAITQNAFFGQCYSNNNSIIPVDDKFSETISESGKYKITLEILDKHQKETTSTSMVVNVK